MRDFSAKKCLVFSQAFAITVASLIAHTSYAEDTADPILAYADSKTFLGNPYQAGAEFSVGDGQTALAKKGVEGKTIDQQRKRYDAELLAQMHDEIGASYSTIGAHYLSLTEYLKAHALTGVKGKYDSDVATELAAIGKYDEAAQYYKKMQEELPDDYIGTTKYGLFLIEQGSYAASRDLLLKQLKATDIDVVNRNYSLLYLYLAAKGAGEDPRLFMSPYSNDLTSSIWPAPLVLYLMGQKSWPALLHDMQADEQGDLCETLFYVGRDIELSGDRQKASAYYRQALRTDETGFSEYLAARDRLKALLPRAPHK